MKTIILGFLLLAFAGGTLATFCCSHHVDAGLFQDTVLSAAFDARRILRRVATFSQAPDHPIIPMIPETVRSPRRTVSSTASDWIRCPSSA